LPVGRIVLKYVEREQNCDFPNIFLFQIM
jgi:hypothetical protein